MPLLLIVAHFTGKKTKAQRGNRTWPKLPRKQVTAFERGTKQYSPYPLAKVKRSLRNQGWGRQVDYLGLLGQGVEWGMRSWGNKHQRPSHLARGQNPAQQTSGSISKKTQSTGHIAWDLGVLGCHPCTGGRGGHFFPKVEAAGGAFPKGEAPVPKMPTPQTQGTIAGKDPGGPGEASALPVTTA